MAALEFYLPTLFVQYTCSSLFISDEMQVNKGDCVNSLVYIVKSGEVKLHDIGHGHCKFDDKILKEGEWFGIRSFFESDTQGRAANVTAKTETSLLALSMVSTHSCIRVCDGGLQRR